MLNFWSPEREPRYSVTRNWFYLRGHRAPLWRAPSVPLTFFAHDGLTKRGPHHVLHPVRLRSTRRDGGCPAPRRPRSYCPHPHPWRGEASGGFVRGHSRRRAPLQQTRGRRHRLRERFPVRPAQAMGASPGGDQVSERSLSSAAAAVPPRGARCFGRSSCCCCCAPLRRYL